MVPATGEGSGPAESMTVFIGRLKGECAVETQERQLELRRLLDERLKLVSSDPEYVGAESTKGDQLVIALVGLAIPAVLLIGGWLIYG